MGLETSTTIAGLNEANPLGTDAKSQGDDHLRLIKSVLKLDSMSISGTHAAATKTTPVDADEIPLLDSATSYVRKRLLWSDLKAAWDALYVKIGAIGSTGITMNTAKVLGRTTASAGAVEELTASTVGLSVLGAATSLAAQTALGTILCDSLDQASAYTVVAADKGKVINCTTGTWSLNLTAAATLGDGFQFAVWNNGAGVITIDPNASETIDGATTKALAAGQLAICYCDGTKFITVGSIVAVTSLNGVTGDVSTTSTYAIGSTILGRPPNYTAYAVGATIAGSSLYCTSPTATYYAGAFPPNLSSFINVGSWRCQTLSYGDGSTTGMPGIWTRYA